jgi:hypothetical protein
MRSIELTYKGRTYRAEGWRADMIEIAVCSCLITGAMTTVIAFVKATIELLSL